MMAPRKSKLPFLAGVPPRLIAVTLALVTTSASGTAIAQDALSEALNPTGTLTGDWGGLRSRLKQDGLDLQLGYTAEPAYNVRGGDRNLVRYADQWVFGATFDLNRLLGVPDALFQITYTDRNGRNLSSDAHLGTLQQVQEIFGRGQTWRLTQFWYNQKYFGGLLDWKVGRLTVGEDFAAFSCAFENLTFCGSQPGNIVGNYWFNWPVSQWATRLKFNVAGFGYVQAGAYQVNPTFATQKNAIFPDFPSGTTGALLPVEFAWLPKLGPTGLPGSYKLGFWYDTSTATDIVEDISHQPQVLTGLPFLDRRGRYGAYINFQQQVTQSPNDPSRGLTLFLNVTQADRRTAMLDNQIAAGMFYTGPFEARPQDTIGLAVGRTHVNGRVADAQRLQNAAGLGPVPVQDAEYAVELFYGVKPIDGLVLRPNLQYIYHPGGTSHNQNAVVLGLKAVAAF